MSAARGVIVFGRGRNPINFVSVADAATMVEQAVVDPRLRGETIEVAGPENLTLLQVAEIFERMTGKTGKKSHVPLPMMRLMSIAMKPVNPIMARQIQASGEGHGGHDLGPGPQSPVPSR